MTVDASCTSTWWPTAFTDPDREILASLGCSTGQGPLWGDLLTTTEAAELRPS